MRVKAASLRALAIFLWLITSAGALLEIIATRGLLIRLYARVPGANLSPSTGPVRLISICSAPILGLLAYLYILVSAQYHSRRKWGSARSWRALGLTVAVELGILLVAYVIL